MNKIYKVIVTRDTTESAEFEVEATHEGEAESIALDVASHPNVKFTPDDGNTPQPGYVTHCEETE